MDNFRRILAGNRNQQFLNTPGVYAFFADGSISDAISYTPEEQQKIIGVLVVDNYEGSLHKIVIDRWDATDETIQFKYSSNNTQITGATIVGNDDMPGYIDQDLINEAMKDMNGKTNTSAIASVHTNYMFAAARCQYQFSGQGYLPSCGEWKIISNNLSAVNRMLDAVGGQRIRFNNYSSDSYQYWSSTLNNKYGAVWVVSLKFSEIYTYVGNEDKYYLRAALDPETYVQRKTPDTPGVYAYFADGSTSTAASFSYDDYHKVIGFLVVDNYPTSSDLRKIVIATYTNVGVDYSYRTSLSGTGALITTDQTTALNDMNGYSNTIAMKSKGIAAATNSANEVQFKGLGHLTSLGELKMLFNNMSAILDMGRRFSPRFNPIPENVTYFSSTLYDAGYTVWAYASRYNTITTESREDTGNIFFITVMNVD